jgi:hypothetical protein
MLRVQAQELALKHDAEKKLFAVSETGSRMDGFGLGMWFYLEQEEECQKFKKLPKPSKKSLHQAAKPHRLPPGTVVTHVVPRLMFVRHWYSVNYFSAFTTQR